MWRFTWMKKSPHQMMIEYITYRKFYWFYCTKKILKILKLYTILHTDNFYVRGWGNFQNTAGVNHSAPFERSYGAVDVSHRYKKIMKNRSRLCYRSYIWDRDHMFGVTFDYATYIVLLYVLNVETIKQSDCNLFSRKESE